MLRCERALFEFGDDISVCACDQAGDQDPCPLCQPVYLDCAGKSPQLKVAADAGRAAINSRSRPWTMPGQGDIEEDVRNYFAGIIILGLLSA
jgi:hypothetical protein